MQQTICDICGKPTDLRESVGLVIGGDGRGPDPAWEDVCPDCVSKIRKLAARGFRREHKKKEDSE